MKTIEKLMDGIGRMTITLIILIVPVIIAEFHSEFLAGVLSVFAIFVLIYLIATTPE